jgi:hypothetical protein
MNKSTLITLLGVMLAFAPQLRAEDLTIDWERAKELHKRASSGETLSAEDQKYYEEAKRQFDKRAQGQPNVEGIDVKRARDIHDRVERGETVSAEDKKYLAEAMQKMQGRSKGDAPKLKGGSVDMERLKEIKGRMDSGAAVSDADKKYFEEARENMRRAEQGGEQRPKTVADAAKGLVPLTELTGNYREWDGGLYGGGSNEVPPTQQAAATKALAQIQPLDADGKPSATGKIVMMSLGMSNTTMEFSKFVELANADERKASNLVIVDAAQGGKAAAQWAGADLPPWNVAEQRIKAAGVSPQQVQVLWVKQANIAPHGSNEAEVARLQDDVQADITIAKQKYPNIRIAFLSNRIFAGYAVTQLNPEPFAYESAFAVRGLIQKQMKGDAALATDKCPVLLWGPYLWGAGSTPRKADGLTWLPEDLGGDGTHPSQSGREKVAKLLLAFFATDANAKPWFTKK